MKAFKNLRTLPFISCLILSFILILPLILQAAHTKIDSDFFKGWHVAGRNSINFSYFDSGGDSANSSYSHKFGQLYNDLSLDFDKKFSPYHQVRGNIAGLVNDSKYRHDRNGFTIERFNLTQEQGETALPYRLELGDVYSFFTPRTIQKSIKGGQIELQPGKKFLGAYNAIQILAGDGTARDYRNSVVGDTYLGASWLMQWSKTGFAINYTANRRQADVETNTAELDQSVVGMSVNHFMEIFSQHLEVDSEFSHFNGNPAGTGSNAHNVENNANAFFFKLAGNSNLPLTYNFLYEDYGQGYQPKGASVSQDRRTIDINSGWRFATGIGLRLRHQIYEDSKDTANQTDTDVWGITLSGGIPTGLFPDLNMNLDAFVNSSNDEGLTFKTRNRSISTSFNATLIKALTGSLQMGFQETENGLTGEKTNRTHSLGVNLAHPLQFAGFIGSLNGGTTFRRVQTTNGGGNDEPGFNLAFNLGKGDHNMDMSVFYRDYQPYGSDDVLSQGINLAYAYTKGPHSIRMDSSINKRDPDVAEYTTDYKIGFTYTFSFEFPGTPAATGAMISEKRPSFPDEDAVLPYTATYLTGLTPGMPMRASGPWLKKAGIGKGVTTGNVQVFEVRFFDTIHHRQRLVLVKDSMDIIEISAVVIDLTNTGSPETIEQLYDELRAILVKRYGSPRIYEQGEFGSDLFAQVNAGQFIRNTEWFTQAGILRIGIPRRLDRKVRIEVQLRKSFPGHKDTLWSVEQVR